MPWEGKVSSPRYQSTIDRTSHCVRFTSVNSYWVVPVGFQCQLKRHSSQSVSGNKQELVARAIRCHRHMGRKPQQRHFPHAVAMQRHFSILHHLSPVILANATIVAFVLLRYSRFSFHSYTQCEQAPTQKSAGKWQLRPLENSCTKDYKGHSLVQTSFTAWPMKLCV